MVASSAFFLSVLHACVQHHAHMSQVSSSVKSLHDPSEGSIYFCVLRSVLSNNVTLYVFCWTTWSWLFTVHWHYSLDLLIELYFEARFFPNLSVDSSSSLYAEEHTTIMGNSVPTGIQARLDLLRYSHELSLCCKACCHMQVFVFVSGFDNVLVLLCLAISFVYYYIQSCFSKYSHSLCFQITNKIMVIMCPLGVKATASDHCQFRGKMCDVGEMQESRLTGSLAKTSSDLCSLQGCFPCQVG